MALFEMSYVSSVMSICFFYEDALNLLHVIYVLFFMWEEYVPGLGLEKQFLETISSGSQTCKRLA